MFSTVVNSTSLGKLQEVHNPSPEIQCSLDSNPYELEVRYFLAWSRLELACSHSLASVACEGWVSGLLPLYTSKTSLALSIGWQIHTVLRSGELDSQSGFVSNLWHWECISSILGLKLLTWKRPGLVTIIFCVYSGDHMVFLLWSVDKVNCIDCFFVIQPCIFKGLPGGSDGKESACSAGDLDLILGLGRSPGEGNGYPLQYSCLENFTDKATWQATIHGVSKSQTQLSAYHLTHFHLVLNFSCIVGFDGPVFC